MNTDHFYKMMIKWGKPEGGYRLSDNEWGSRTFSMKGEIVYCGTVKRSFS